MDKQWFAIRTKVRREEEAMKHFLRQGFEGYLPRTLVRCCRAGKIRWEVRPYFPGYLFLHLARSEQRWTTIRSTIGAIGAVRFGSHYPPVPGLLIQMLKDRENDEGLIELDRKPTQVFRPGDHVKVFSGPMQGVEGVFESMRGEDRVIVLLTWLSRQVRVDLPVDKVIALS